MTSIIYQDSLFNNSYLTTVFYFHSKPPQRVADLSFLLKHLMNYPDELSNNTGR